jgi:hypothetical protein
MTERRLPSDYIVLMRRRLPALLTCLLVLTSSVSASSVCDSMSHRSKQDSSHHATPRHAERDLSLSPQSHHKSDKGTRYNHCENAPSCAGVALTTQVLLITVTSVGDRVMPTAAMAPAGNSLDLEPPPPKA